MYYDYLLTFPDEINFFWYRKRSSVSILFFLNRYFPLLSNIPVFAMNFGNWSQQVSVRASLGYKLKMIFHPYRGTIIICILPLTTLTELRCGQFITYYQLSLVMSQVIVAGPSLLNRCIYHTHPLSKPVIMTLRTYALFGRSRRVLGVLLMSLAFGIGAGVVGLL